MAATRSGPILPPPIPGCRRRCAAFVDGLRGIHKFVPRENPKAGSEYNERIKRRALASEHPLVTVHAETGERVLFVEPLLSEVGRRAHPARKPEAPGAAVGARRRDRNTPSASSGTPATSHSGTIARPRISHRPTFSSPISIASCIASRWWDSRSSASMAGLPPPSRGCPSCPRRKSCG